MRNVTISRKRKAVQQARCARKKRASFDSDVRLLSAIRSMGDRSGSKNKVKTTVRASTRTGYVRPIAGPRVPFRTSRPKPISNKLKGVPKKFATKVQKVINKNEAWGEFVWVGNKQLRQINHDEYNIENVDEFGMEYMLDTPQSILCAASRLYLSKLDNENNPESLVNGAGLTDTFDRATPITVLSSGMNFFFKSTSSHVVNIEMYECTAKGMESTVGARGWADASFDDYEFKVVRNFVVRTDGLRQIGCEAKYLTSLHNHWNVKVHKVKLLPGESSSIYVAGMKKTHDFSQMMAEGNALRRWAKGAKSVFFRIINDVTVAGGASNRVHSFASNGFGGVAMRYTRTYRIAPPKSVAQNVAGSGVTADFTRMRNVVMINQQFNVVESPTVDQQVARYNPANKATTD